MTHEDNRGVWVPTWMLSEAPSPAAAVLLAQVAWLFQPGLRGRDRARFTERFGHRWLALSDHELADHLGMNEDAVYRARAALRKSGLLVTKTAKVDGVKRSLVRPNPDVLLKSDTADARYSPAADPRDSQYRESAGSTSTKEHDGNGGNDPAASAAVAAVPWPVPMVVAEGGRLHDSLALCSLLGSQLAVRGELMNGQTLSKRWVLDMEALLRIDGRTADEVERVLRWLDRGADEVSAFWRANVRSPSKLRVRWARMSEDYARLKTGPPKKGAPKVALSPAAQRLAAEHYGRAAHGRNVIDCPRPDAGSALPFELTK